MRRVLRALLAAVLLPLALGIAFLTTGQAAAAALTRITDFGTNPTNPTNLNMYLYVPDNVAPQPALLVLVHYCGGSAGAIFNGNGRDFATAATAGRTRSGGSTRTARSPGCSRGCAWRSSAARPPTEPRCGCGPATGRTTSAGPSREPWA